MEWFSLFECFQHREGSRIRTYKRPELGEITRQTSNKWLFKDGAATELPVGTKIYESNDDDTYNLFIELEEEEIVYVVLLEG